MILTTIIDFITGNRKKRIQAQAKRKLLDSQTEAFSQALEKGENEKAVQILKEHSELITYKPFKESHVMRQLAQKLAQPDADNRLAQLYITLHKAGFNSSPTDIAFISKQLKNAVLMPYLYQNQENIRPAINRVNPLYALAKNLAFEPKENAPYTHKELATLFVQMEEGGMRADAKTVALLFHRAENTPIIQYVFLMQPELLPGKNDEHDKWYMYSAVKGKNSDGFKLLFESGAQIKGKYIRRSGLLNDSMARLYRTRTLRAIQQRAD